MGDFNTHKNINRWKLTICFSCNRTITPKNDHFTRLIFYIKIGLLKMTISNLSNITNGAIITANNPTPFKIVVDSPFNCKVKVDIYQGTTDETANKITTVEMLNYSNSTNYHYFVCDLKSILTTLFANSLDDIEQTSNTWETIENALFDVLLVVTASNGVDSNQTLNITFTVFNACTQVNNDNRIVENTLSIYNDVNETYYSGANNVVYIYQLARIADTLTTEPNSSYIFTDTNNDTFTDNNENILIE